MAVRACVRIRTRNGYAQRVSPYDRKDVRKGVRRPTAVEVGIGPTVLGVQIVLTTISSVGYRPTRNKMTPVSSKLLLLEDEEKEEDETHTGCCSNCKQP